MDPSPNAPRKRRGCFWKAPLGCLAFAAGMGVVLSALLPYACGKVGERELEGLFAEHHAGRLTIQSARLGAVAGEQGFWGVALEAPDGTHVLRGQLTFPSIGELVAEGVEARPVELELATLRIVERALPDGRRTTNLQQALAPRAQQPNVPTEDGLSSVWGGLVVDLEGVRDVDLVGHVRSFRWRGLDGRTLVAPDGLELTGALSRGEHASLELELAGDLAFEPDEDEEWGPAQRLTAAARFDERPDGRLALSPSKLVVELEGGAAGQQAVGPSSIPELLDAALSTLGAGHMERGGALPLWILADE